MTMQKAVEQFHRAVGHPVSQELTQIPDERAKLRMRLISEECVEVLLALAGLRDGTPAYEDEKDWLLDELDGLAKFRREVDAEVDLTDLARQVADLHYVLSGTSVEFGIPEDAVFAEVHAANMRKVGGPKRDDGKQQRPEGWQPPDVAGVLRRHAEGIDYAKRQGEMLPMPDTGAATPYTLLTFAEALARDLTRPLRRQELRGGYVYDFDSQCYWPVPL